MITLQYLDYQIHVSVLLIKDMQVSCIHTISKVSKISINALQCLAQQLHVSILPRMYMQVAGLHNTCKYPTYQACCGRRQEHVGALTFAGLHGRMVPASLAQLAEPCLKHWHPRHQILVEIRTVNYPTKEH